MVTSSDQAKKIVVLTTVGTMVLTTLATVRKHDHLPGIRLPIGAFVVGTLLAAAAEVQPQFAATLGAVMLTTAAVGIGPEAWDATKSATKSAPSTSTTH